MLQLKKKKKKKKKNLPPQRVSKADVPSVSPSSVNKIKLIVLKGSLKRKKTFSALKSKIFSLTLKELVGNHEKTPNQRDNTQENESDRVVGSCASFTERRKVESKQSQITTLN